MVSLCHKESQRQNSEVFGLRGLRLPLGSGIWKPAPSLAHLAQQPRLVSSCTSKVWILLFHLCTYSLQTFKIKQQIKCWQC